MLPMLQGVAAQYELRVPQGYPHVVDSAEQGMLGIELDPSYALYITSEGDDLYAEVYKRQSRTDTRSSSSRQKYGGLPFQDRRPLESNPSDQTLRNLIAELKQAYNYQGGLLYITDD
jgi:hypothetical protein